MVIVQLVGAVAALRGLERPVADDVHGLQTVSHVADKGDDMHVRGRVRGQDAIVKVRRAVFPDQGDAFRPNTLFVGLQNKLKVHDKASGVLVRLCLRPYDAPGGDVKEVRACKDLRLAVHADDALPREKLPPCRVAAKFLKQRSENALAALVGPPMEFLMMCAAGRGPPEPVTPTIAAMRFFSVGSAGADVRCCLAGP